MAVQRHVSVRTAANHQLALVAARRAADQRIGFEHGDRLDDLAQPDCDVRYLMLFQVFEDPVEVIADRGGQLDPRQRYLPSLRAAGRRAGLPAMRASRYPRTSSQGMVSPVSTMRA